MCRAKEAQSAVVKSEAEKPPPIPISKRPYAWLISVALSWVVFFLVFFQVGFFKEATITKELWLAAVILSGLAAAYLPLLICGMKNKWGFMAVSAVGMLLFSRVQIIFTAMFVLAVVGAVRLAKPDSWWARTYYGPEKMAIATNQFSRKPTQGHDENPRQRNRRSGWIIAASIGGLILSVPVLLLVAGFIKGITSARRSVAEQATTFDAQNEVAAESYLRNLGLEKFRSEEFGFSVMMPKQFTPVTMEIGTVFSGEINGHSITVTAKNIPRSDPGYDTGVPLESWRADFVMGLRRNKNLSNVDVSRKVKDKNGNIGIEYSFTLEKGGKLYHGQGYGFKKGHRLYFVQIGAPVSQWDKTLASRELATFALD
jgi:hypothetical protein